MTQRRYTEAEIAAIFERAAEAQQTTRRQLPPGEGMTLAELQEIGRDVGLPPELVADAARSIDRGGRPTSRTFLGLPIGVGRTIELERRLSEEEWQQLVADLRETFDARGSIRYDGPFRQWTNGNLQALLEPTPGGHRLRLQTVKGNARGLMTAGLGVLGITAASAIVSLASGGLAGLSANILSLAAIGMGLFGIGAVRLPSWARQRRAQMAAIAERLALTTETRSPEIPPAEDR